jgi:hypothetical protein
MRLRIDPCKAISSIDFNNDRHLEAILLRDKHTRIEGICTENLFVNELIKNTFREFSVGWWFKLKNNSYNVIKFVPKLAAVKDIDLFILDYFKSRGVNSFIVCFDDLEKDFFYIDYMQIRGDNFPKLGDKLKVRFPKKREVYPPIPKETERNVHRMEQAVRMLKSLNVLRKSALERVFANCWLASGPYWDIDSFVRYKDKIIAFEVKQKYPTAQGTFGLNVGLAKLFSFLSSLGIEVVHIILTKPVRNYKIPAIDFYTKKEYRNKLSWIGLKFTTEILSRSVSVAPAKTSIFGANKLRFYHINPKSFHFIAKLDKEGTSNLIKFLNGHTKPLTSLSDLKED